MEQKRMISCLVAVFLAYALVLPWISWAAVPFKLPTQSPDSRNLWIGVLEGTWKEMGIQYGERAAKDVAWAFDTLWEVSVLNGTQPWNKGKSKEELARYTNLYMERQLKEFSYLSPEIVEFFEGIARGASIELAKCKYAQAIPDVLKIALLNNHDLHFHPNWNFDTDSPRAEAKDNLKGRTILAENISEDCNALWVSGEATRTKHTYAHRHTHNSPMRERQVSYVAIPKDPRARVFWGSGIAGALGGLGGGLMNDCGVCCLTSGAQYQDSYAKPNETLAPGIKDFMLAAYGVIFSKSAREAVERITVGTENYRKSTGRSTVLRARGCNILFGDEKEAFVVEQNAHHYAIRGPGDQAELGANYLVIANHFEFKKGSFDDNNQFNTNIPMDSYCPEYIGASSSYRYWTGMWFLRNSYKQIDREMVIDFAGTHYIYSKDGLKDENLDAAGAPKVGPWCAHSKPFTAEHPLGVDGSHSVPVFDLTTREVWWVATWPCHYKEWKMDWNYIDLKAFQKHGDSQARR